jgi:hypothetical protein
MFHKKGWNGVGLTVFHSQVKTMRLVVIPQSSFAAICGAGALKLVSIFGRPWVKGIS